MKSWQQYKAEPARQIDPSDSMQIDRKEYEAINLTAFKAGMTEAAEKYCHNNYLDFTGGSTGNAMGTMKRIQQAILTARDKKTTI